MLTFDIEIKESLRDLGNGKISLEECFLDLVQSMYDECEENEEYELIANMEKAIQENKDNIIRDKNSANDMWLYIQHKGLVNEFHDYIDRLFAETKGEDAFESGLRSITN